MEGWWVARTLATRWNELLLDGFDLNEKGLARSPRRVPSKFHGYEW
jgi:hypothetical protein